MMELIIFAMKSEASDILDSLKPEKINDNIFEIYQHKSFIFVISGIGTINANICLTYILNKFRNINAIYNFGTVGTLKSKVKPFDIILINKSFWFLYDEIIHNIKHTVLKGFQTKLETVLTSDFFIQHNSIDEIIAKFTKHPFIMKKISIPSVVDMEFSSLLYVSKKYKKKIYGIKVVSDSTDSRSNEGQFKKNMLYCRKILREIFFEMFSLKL